MYKRLMARNSEACHQTVIPNKEKWDRCRGANSEHAGKLNMTDKLASV